MNNEQFFNDLSVLLVQIKEYIFDLIPRLFGAVIIILIGILIAHIIKALVNRFINNFDRFIPNIKLQTKLKQMNLEKSAGLFSKILYWILIIFFLTAATETLGLPIITTWLSGLVMYLPNILIAVIIVFLGITGGRLLRDFITNASDKAGIVYGSMVGRIVHYVVIFITILIAVDQVGINIVILTGVINIVLAAILFGAALAFGLGARTSVSNILASYYLQSRYQEGQAVKIGDIEGQIIQITPTAVILETAQGQVSVPARKFSELNSTLLKKEGSVS